MLRRSAINSGETLSTPFKALLITTTTSQNTCRWYSLCPIKRFVDQGRLDAVWVETHCLIGNRRCVRYYMEEQGHPHPDNMLPDGQIDPTLPD